MEYILLNDHPHIKSRHDKLVSRGLHTPWLSIFSSKHKCRMKLHIEKLHESVGNLIAKELNLMDDAEHFSIIHSRTLGFIVLARGKKDVG